MSLNQRLVKPTRERPVQHLKISVKDAVPAALHQLLGGASPVKLTSPFKKHCVREQYGGIME